MRIEKDYIEIEGDDHAFCCCANQLVPIHVDEDGKERFNIFTKRRCSTCKRMWCSLDLKHWRTTLKPWNKPYPYILT